MADDDPVSLFVAACTAFGVHVHAIREDQWSLPTPCAEWNVRELVNHVVVEDLWAVELFAGATIESVGSAFDGDRLGGDAVKSWDEAVSGAIYAVGEPGAMTRIVHLSFGDLPGSEYAMQLFADHLVHAWDLATAVSRDPGLDPALVAACRAWFAANEDGYRSAGAIGPRREISDDAGELAQLLSAFGRTP